MTNLCALCQTPFTKDNSTKEHVILNAIGGRKKVRDFICKSCNDKTGEKWDSALASQLQSFCTMLDIARERGDNRPLSVETLSGRKVIWNPDGSFNDAELTIARSTSGDKTHFQIHASSKSHLRKTISKMTKKHYPNVDVNKLMLQATESQEYLQEPIQIHFEIGGALAGRSIVKSCLALACEVGLTIDDCENAKNYLLGGGEACFGYFNETDPITNRPNSTPIHCVYVLANAENGLVLAYAEYFGFLKIVACLSSNYSGTTIECCYAVNPLTGKELDVEVVLTLTREDISAIYNYERWDYGRVKFDIGNTLWLWKDIKRNRVVERAVKEAIDDVCSQLGIRDGDVLADEKVAEFSDLVFYRIAPTLIRLKLGQSFTDEDIEAIVRVLENSDNEKK